MAPAAPPPLLAAAQGLSFAPPVNYGVGAYPGDIVLRDFNGDGRPDLAVGNSADWPGSISVLLSNGNGTFQNAIAITTGWGPFSIAAGDFNADGIADLVATNLASASISVLIGNGNATFQSPVFYATGTDPISVAVGDFNGDGKPDVAVANYSAASVSVLLGNGNGTFQNAVTLGVASGPYCVAVADFNGDGRADMAVASLDSDNVTVLLGNGNGTFQSPQYYSSGAGSVFIAIGDFNSDGRLDLAVANYGGNSVTVLLGNGNGSFHGAGTYGVGQAPFGVAIGDYNGDGIADLASANYNSNNISVMLGNGDGSFQSATSITAGDSPFSLIAGDFNVDGKTDLAVVNNVGYSIGILLNTAGGGGGGGTKTLTLSKTGTGSGTVTSNPAGINCGTTCSAPFASGQVVALTATPASGSAFVSLSGDSGCSAGSVTMSLSRSCVARFDLISTPPQALKAFFMGTPGQDYVGQGNQLTANGHPDWNIHLQGMRSTPVRVVITSSPGGVWEDPFNGSSWIILTQADRAGNGDLWFEPWSTPGFHVKLWYADGTTDEVDAGAGVITPTSLKAAFLGVTGEDIVGPVQETANGIPDWHIRLQGLRSSPVKVQITSSPDGVWQAPFNGGNWTIATRQDGSGNVDLFYEPLNNPAGFHVKVWYSDGTTDEVDAAAVITTPSSFQATFLGVTGEDIIGPVPETANGIPDWHVRLQGLRSSPVKVQITSSAGGTWETPFNGWSWTIATRLGSSGNADLFYEPWSNPAGFHVKVWYSDSTTDEVDAH